MARDRYLSMVEVADLMELHQRDRHSRARYVRRLIQRMERRDKRLYLTKRGKDYYIAVSALEQLMPWDPGTLTKLRGDLSRLGGDLSHVRHQLKSHGARIGSLERFRKAARRFLVDIGGEL